MKNIFKSIMILALVPVMTGCFDEAGSEIAFPGDVSQVELNAASAASGDFTYLRENIGAELDAGFVVTLTSTANTGGVEVTFELDASSTATEGDQFNLNGTTVTIPAGEFTAPLPITVNPDNIEAGERWTIVVNLTGATGAELSPNFSTATHTVQISCPPNIGIGNYVTATAGIPDPDGCATGFAYSGEAVTVTYDAGTETYTVSDADIGYFSGDYTAAADFVNICDRLTISPNSGAPYGIGFTGSGIFIPGGGANGTGQIVFQCYYDATYAGAGATETVAYDAAADVNFDY
ncbi:hypothetical protein [Ekhidna sp.]|uniref:hypothetical protein n=1 Tax=Ekhidna sp. TaxID=2608089 RepID=UPI003BADA74A